MMEYIFIYTKFFAEEGCRLRSNQRWYIMFESRAFILDRLHSGWYVLVVFYWWYSKDGAQNWLDETKSNQSILGEESYKLLREYLRSWWSTDFILVTLLPTYIISFIHSYEWHFKFSNEIAGWRLKTDSEIEDTSTQRYQRRQQRM